MSGSATVASLPYGTSPRSFSFMRPYAHASGAVSLRPMHGMGPNEHRQRGPERGPEHGLPRTSSDQSTVTHIHVKRKGYKRGASGIETRHLGDDAQACNRFNICRNSSLLPMAPPLSFFPLPSLSPVIFSSFPPSLPPLSAAPSPNHLDPHRIRPDCNQPASSSSSSASSSSIPSL